MSNSGRGSMPRGGVWKELVSKNHYRELPDNSVLWVYPENGEWVFTHLLFDGTVTTRRTASNMMAAMNDADDYALANGHVPRNR